MCSIKVNIVPENLRVFMQRGRVRCGYAFTHAVITVIVVSRELQGQVLIFRCFRRKIVYM